MTTKKVDPSYTELMRVLNDHAIIDTEANPRLTQVNVGDDILLFKTYASMFLFFIKGQESLDVVHLSAVRVGKYALHGIIDPDININVWGVHILENYQNHPTLGMYAGWALQ